MTRLLAELSEDAALSRDEVAMLFDREDLDAGIRKFSAASDAGRVRFSMRTNRETGEAEYRLGDVEAVHASWKGKTPATGPDDGVKPPEVRAGGRIIFADDSTPDAILLSDDDAGGKGKGTMAIPVAKAAEQAGLSEDDLTDRLVGRARLKVVDGVMVVPLADLRELAEGGSIPKPSKQAPAEQKPDPLAVPADAAADRRTEGMAAALGITANPVTPAEQTQQQAGIQTVTAKARPHRRLGQPRRWSER